MKKIMVQSELNLDQQFKIYNFFSIKSSCMHACGKAWKRLEENTACLKFGQTVHALLSRVNNFVFFPNPGDWRYRNFVPKFRWISADFGEFNPKFFEF